MRPNERVKERRLGLGLTENEIASRLGISVSAYADLEDYEHEIFDQVSVARANQLCAILGLDLCDLLGIRGDGAPSSINDENRSTMVRSARDRLKLSTAALAESTGFAASMIESLERDDPSIDEQCPVRFMLDVASALAISPCRLLRSAAQKR